MSFVNETKQRSDFFFIPSEVHLIGQPGRTYRRNFLLFAISQLLDLGGSARPARRLVLLFPNNLGWLLVRVGAVDLRGKGGF